MGFFQNMKNGFARFMYGRNGVDRLGLATVWISLILDVASMLVTPHGKVLGAALYWAAMALWAVTIFRIFSKNLYRRREENARWTGLWSRLRGRSSGARARHADKDHKYFTCKSCKTICRVPVGKGRVVITCPKCGAEIHGKT